MLARIEWKGDELLITRVRPFRIISAIAFVAVIMSLMVWMLSTVWTGDAQRGLSDAEFVLFSGAIVAISGVVIYRLVYQGWRRNRDVCITRVPEGFSLDGVRFGKEDLTALVVFQTPTRYGGSTFAVALEIRDRALAFLGTGLGEEEALQMRVELERFLERKAVVRSRMMSP